MLSLRKQGSFLKRNRIPACAGNAIIKMSNKKNHTEATRLAHMGLSPDDYHGIVNPPIARVSTILYPSLAAYEDPGHIYRYGRMGNPLSDAFEQAMCEIEQGVGAISTGSGLSAITTTLLAFLESGDHALIVDTAYPPLRDFVKNTLARFGVEVEYYDPMIGGDIAGLIRDNTRMIYMESPGSGTFEVQDVPAIVAAAQARGVMTAIDNTYSAGILFKPFTHGVDIAIQSCTKYIGGHSDINLGIAVARQEEHYQRLKKTAVDMGICAGAEDLYGGLRGLRTLAVRMKQAEENALTLLEWLQGREEVAQLYHPALPGHLGHEIWKRDFSGANGLLTVRLKPAPEQVVHDFVNALELFPIGSSWGGYESLLQPQYPHKTRTTPKWEAEGRMVRLQVGLEDPQDLIADLERAFGVLS